ncbi:MAG TPA: 4a-hydroxytetrahydrobiopterin dehydratase [Bacteroidia bacterium]|nr:4a-hydroxytetrahydrobiopterin dehydratase [Bacteroidia bacterium]
MRHYRIPDTSELQDALNDLPGWELGEKRIQKHFEFKGFAEAMQFVNTVARMAEQMDHHPDWSNSFNKVFLSLSTQSLNAITETDLQMALGIEKLYTNGI